MRDDNEPGDTGAAPSLLAEAREHYDIMLHAVQGKIRELKRGEAPDGKDCRRAINEYSAAVALLLRELHKVEDHDARDSSGHGAGRFDFDSLRAEVGRRLARLRAAERSGDFSGYSG
jgi:hypothetical protein